MYLVGFVIRNYHDERSSEFKNHLCLLSVRTQRVDHCTFRSHLLHVSAVWGHHQVDFTITCMEKNTEVDMKGDVSNLLFFSIRVIVKST